MQPNFLSRHCVLVRNLKLLDFISSRYEWCPYRFSRRCCYGTLQFLQLVNDWTGRYRNHLSINRFYCISNRFHLLRTFIHVLFNNLHNFSQFLWNLTFNLYHFKTHCNFCAWICSQSCIKMGFISQLNDDCINCRYNQRFCRICSHFNSLSSSWCLWRRINGSRNHKEYRFIHGLLDNHSFRWPYAMVH